MTVSRPVWHRRIDWVAIGMVFGLVCLAILVGVIMFNATTAECICDFEDGRLYLMRNPFQFPWERQTCAEICLNWEVN